MLTNKTNASQMCILYVMFAFVIHGAKCPQS